MKTALQSTDEFSKVVQRPLNRVLPYGTLTVVIPTKDSARTLERCLASVRSQVDLRGEPLGVEIVVVDNSSTDGTAAIGRTSADRFETKGPERCAQRNFGMRLATNEIVLFIDSDMVLEPLVCAQTFAAFNDQACGAVVVPEQSFGEGFWARCRSLEKRIAVGDRRTEAARGFRVSALRETGAWNESLTAAEDWDLTDRVIAAGWTISRCDALIRHDEGHVSLLGTFRKKRYYGQWVGAYLEQSQAVSDTVRPSDRRSRLSPLRILAKPRLLLEQPHVSVGLVVLKAVDALGIGLGVIDAKRSKWAVNGNVPKSS